MTSIAQTAPTSEPSPVQKAPVETPFQLSKSGKLLARDVTDYTIRNFIPSVALAYAAGQLFGDGRSLAMMAALYSGAVSPLVNRLVNPVEQRFSNFAMQTALGTAASMGLGLTNSIPKALLAPYSGIATFAFAKVITMIPDTCSNIADIVSKKFNIETSEDTTTTHGQVLSLSDENFEESISQGLTLVDFYANWCMPCKILAPAVEKLAGELEGRVKVAKLNIDQAPNASEKYKVEMLPTLVMFKDGQEISRLVGLASSEKIRALIPEDSTSSN